MASIALEHGTNEDEAIGALLHDAIEDHGREGQTREETLIEGEGRDHSYVIKSGEQLVWKERARFEDWSRFDEIKQLLRLRYGERFKSVTPTSSAWWKLRGDSMSARLTFT